MFWKYIWIFSLRIYDWVWFRHQLHKVVRQTWRLKGEQPVFAKSNPFIYSRRYILNVTFHWNFCYSIITKILLFPNFVSVLWVIYKSLVLFHYFRVINEFTFLIYLSMPIDDVAWQARVDIFNSSKSIFKTKTKNRVMLYSFLHHTVYSLYLFLTFILIA